MALSVTHCVLSSIIIIAPLSKSCARDVWPNNGAYAKTICSKRVQTLVDAVRGTDMAKTLLTVCCSSILRWMFARAINHTRTDSNDTVGLTRALTLTTCGVEWGR